MRIGFHYHVPAIKKEGIIYVPGSIGSFISSLAKNASSVVCFLHSPINEEINEMDFPIMNTNVSLVDIGPHLSVPERMLNIRKVKGKINENLKLIDIMLLRGPSPLLPVIAKACKNIPVSLLIVGDYLAGVNSLPQPRWRKEIIRIWSWWNSQSQLQIAKKSLTFVNSHNLYNQFKKDVPNIIETRTTTLSMSDFFIREDTCQSRPLHILYTGRIDRSKGLIDILDAIKNLIDQGEDLIYDLVGNIGKDKSILNEIKSKASKYNISNRIIYHGYKPLGEELFEFYKNSDIYIIASQDNEGFPRTIWEAMAHSLPVIATRVGSIPAYIDDVAELVNPRSVDELSNAIKRLINDQDRRKDLIAKGFILAKTNTLEIRSSEMVFSLKNYLSKMRTMEE